MAASLIISQGKQNHGTVSDRARYTMEVAPKSSEEREEARKQRRYADLNKPKLN